MVRQKIKLAILTLTTTLFFTINLFATDGYFRHGYGIKYSALAGSGVAVSLSSLGAITNPAGLAFLPTQYNFNIAFFSPTREYTVTGNPSGMQGTFGLLPGTIESETKLFVFPTLGANWKINPTMAVGLVVYGNGGMNTDYPTQTFYDPSSPSTGVNLEQLFVGATYAIEFIKDHSLGVTALFAWQKFRAKGLASFSAFSSDPANLTGNSNSISTGFGGKVGYQGEFGNIIRLGASFQTKMYMNEFDRYKGLFAEMGDFDIPANWQAGIAVMPNQELTLMLDVQQILYSGVKSIANPMDLVNNSPSLPNGTPNTNFQPLGTNEGWGFGWEDMTIVKFGVMYELPQSWTLYGGYSYGKQPIPEAEVLFNILAPGVVDHHITLGLSKMFCNSQEVMIALMYAPAGSVKGINPLDPPSQQTIELQMSQFQVEVGYAFSLVQ
jgi:long-chain fatty acid transport protein